jgi:epoxyqueuosine reductase
MKDSSRVKRELCGLVLEAGFVRARILAPFNPAAWGGPSGPRRNFEGAPSLLVTALAYGGPDPGPSAGSAEAGSAALLSIAPFARRNYYREAVKRLQELARQFRPRYGGRRRDYRILCNSPTPEKPLAAACGLGAPGRNGLIITPEAGSRVILAAMTLPFALEGDGPVEGFCNACGTKPPCAAACPTGALEGGRLDLTRCIQWYASGKGERVPPEVVRRWGKRLYGCAYCQDACVQNRRAIPGAASGEGPLPAYIDGEELLALDDEAIRARFKGTAMGLSWLGPAAIRRSAALGLGRY